MIYSSEKRFFMVVSSCELHQCVKINGERIRSARLSDINGEQVNF